MILAPDTLGAVPPTSLFQRYLDGRLPSFQIHIWIQQFYKLALISSGDKFSCFIYFFR